MAWQEGRITEHRTALSELPPHLARQADADNEYADSPQQSVVEEEAITPPASAEPSPSASASPGPTPAPAAASGWPGAKCLIGLAVGSNALTGPQVTVPSSQVYQAVFVGRVEAIWWPVSQPAPDIAALRRASPDLFVVACLDRPFTPASETVEAYVQAAVPLLQPLYQDGVRYCLLQPQRESAFNVWRALFGSVRELSNWFVQAQALLKGQLPDLQVGFAAIRPPYDPSWAVDTARFLDEADPAMRAAEWIGVPCTWTTPAQREAEDAGRHYRRYRERYPDKVLIITAFGSGSVLGQQPVAQEYVDYYQSVRGLANVAAAFADQPLAGGALPNAWMSANGLPGWLAQAVGARHWGEPGDPPENFASFATNDRPEGKDELGYDDYASAFVRVLSNPDTKTPLTIGIYGAWGMGKSFLMKRIRAMVDERQAAREEARRRRPFVRRAWDNLKLLRPLGHPARSAPEAESRAAAALRRAREALARVFTRTPTAEVDFRCVEFNAWVYSGSENLWAGLITHLYNDVEKFLGTRRTVPFRFSQNAKRAARKTIWLLALYGLLGLVVSVLLDFDQIRTGIATAGQAATTLVLGGTLAAALATLPVLLGALRDVANSLTLARSAQLAALASRRDFKDKIGFMADIKEEIGTVRALLDRGRQGVRTRLVIFIDDLDRCEPKKAVEVLEAIMLLLADEDGMPFVVVLGIDARIVVKAVEERYGKVLTEAGISGYEYLDKIVQIPFRIPPPPSTALAGYVTSLLWPSAEQRQKDEAAAQAASPAGSSSRLGSAEPAGSGPATASTGGGKPLAAPAEPASPTARGRDEPSVLDLAQAVVRIPQWVVPSPEVNFLADEREAFEAYAKGEHLSPNPRRVKRILNIYRVVRLLKPNTTPAERQRMIKWVVLTEQWPFRTAWLLQAAEDDGQRPAEARQLKDGDGLRSVYRQVLADVNAKDAQPFASLDADPDLFDTFIETSPLITVADLRRLRPYTFNLNPALQGEVTKAVGRKVKES
jgi:hypothetical protein